MKILAIEKGKTSQGEMTYAIVWKKDEGVFLLRFLDEPFKMNWKPQHEVAKTSIFTLIWWAHNCADPNFTTPSMQRRCTPNDFDFHVLAGVYRKFLEQAQGLLSYSKWNDALIYMPGAE
jgi:hypothetical protein